ncbi:MAG: SpoIID/LytB domain-containing protein [Ruminiclostridium sp.]|nr:SpoIID/LytB domain-containing protein [Ruminiclostridium sp.]
MFGGETTEKGSVIKITIALMIICLYVFLFGIMGTIDSIDVSIEAEAPPSEIKISAPAVTSGVNEEGMAVYTYATRLNVVNAKKPGLADYTRTETMLLIPSEDDTTGAVTTAVTDTADFVMSGDDLNYTVPVTTTTTAPVTEATTEATTTVPPETTTTAAPVTAAAEVSSETTTVPPVSEAEDEDDIEDAEETEEGDVVEEVEEDEAEDDVDGGEVTVVTTTEPAETTTVSEKEEAETTGSDVSANNEIFTVNANGTIITDTALNIVSAAVMAEISDVFDDEAIKAQAIAAYTYIKYYNLNHQNAYIAKSTPSKRVKDLVSQVIGKGLYYNGSLIQAVYTASTAGRTASSKNVWGIDYPYLPSIDTGFIDKEYDINYGRKATFSSEKMKEYVLNSTGIELTGDPSEWFTIESYTDEIFVGQMTVGGNKTYNNGTRDVKITGRVFRETIMDFDIRSACFDISYDASTDEFTITTYGYGHCVGLSQHGANILASQYGYTYDRILAFYYPGAEIH